MRPNFTECALEFFSHSSTLYSKYIFNVSTSGLGLPDDSARSILMTWQGCRSLCGTGTDYYTWREASNTITTWVLPIIGLLVQAPYESNQAWQTVLALCRWVGNPIAALSYIFWNIKVTGKCALMVDMATRYDEYPGQGTEFSRMRDSLFILSIMNQCLYTCPYRRHSAFCLVHKCECTTSLGLDMCSSIFSPRLCKTVPATS